MERRTRTINLCQGLALPSPLQEVHWSATARQQVHLWVKRDDLIHPRISGNKWRKLKYNLMAISKSHHQGIVTYGGAFSNHIHATAAAGQHYGFKTVGIIRGEDDKDNPTLQAVRAMGMTLHFVSRADYRQKADSLVIRSIIEGYKDLLLLPEGGSNDPALRGCQELIEEINAAQRPDHLIVSAGTGATAAGIINGLEDGQHLWVVSALKGSFLEREIQKRVHHARDNWTLLTDYHRGGYARVDSDLIDFIELFGAETGIPLDPIYNGKAIMALADLLKTGQISSGSTVCYIHTGGLQGITAYNYLAKKQGKQLLNVSPSPNRDLE